MKNKKVLLGLILSFLFVCTLPFGAVAQLKDGGVPVRETLSLNPGWRFYKGDIIPPVIKGHDMTYGSCKAGKAFGAAAPDFDDTSWRSLSLPHDWAVESSFDQNNNLSQGFRERGIGWYRRNFKLNPSDNGKHLELQFEGVASHCTVWVNGTLVHRNWCGYTSFYIDITALAKYGDDLNNVAIRVDANVQEGWWYEGAGIYRNTWLVKRSPVHLITDGVFANPVKKDGAWSIPVEATLENSGKQNADVVVETVVTDASGKEIASGSGKATVAVLSKAVAQFTIPVQNPKLWSVDEPTLYTVKTTVKNQNKVIDQIETRCGFRTLRFSPESGFYLNDKPLKIKGTCNHQDHAGVGVAMPASLWDFRLKKLKEMGSNAVRCSHNPPSKEFLDACDRLGVLVMDENRNFNISPEYMGQLEWMVRRDRNHPSIILWSVFNEEPMQGTESGYEMVRRMSALVKKLDTTRPVTAAMNGGLFSPKNVSTAVDVVGFNYQIDSYDRFHKEHPEMCLTSSEDVSGVMQRGQYVTDKSKNLLDEYDTQHPSWGTTHRIAWKAIAERPFLAGCFVWTGFDYRGEPTPFGWPTVSSNFGIMDLCGFPKTAFYLHQAQWVEDKPILKMVPHWNWPSDSIGKKIRVMVLSNAEKVKLFLNGKAIGMQVVDKYEMNTWYVPFKPGKLEVVGYQAGKEVSRFKVETTGEPASLQMIPDRLNLAGDGQDAMPVTVQTLDATGRPVPTANIPVEFKITGPAQIIGLGNGNPNSHESEKGNKYSLFNGLAQVILQSQANKTGVVTLTATSAGLKPAVITLNVQQAVQVPFVAVSNPVLILDKWRLSPFTATKPDPNQKIAANDQNSWAPTRAGQLQKFTDGFAVYRASFDPYSEQQKKGAKIILKGLAGKAEVWVDNVLVGTKNSAETADMEVTIPAKRGSREISVLIETEKGKSAGLGGVVSVQ
ncbi:MAG: beta-galactosidase GalA [Bacteroidales bacterium]|nr:beta-galactosidase GalA [Bacteroidales bacterium]